MKSLASGPERTVSLGQAVDRVPRRWPIATTSVLAVTVVVTVLQFPFPAVRLALWRDPDALAAGQWWRLVTALFVQNDLWWQIVIVFALIAGIGAFAERLFGPGRWLLLYFGCGWSARGSGSAGSRMTPAPRWPAPGCSVRCTPGCCRRPGRPWPGPGSGG